MFTMLVLAHLLGDYLLQPDAVARWKAKSPLGIVAHGAIVTTTTLACVACVDLAWWPYALFIGAFHTLIDLLRAHLVPPVGSREAFIWFFVDQGMHLLTLALATLMSGRTLGEMPRGLDPRLLALVLGYVALLQPAWVALRFLVRGVWGEEAAPPLGRGEKYDAMIERVLMATLVLTGQFYLVPLVLVPRRVRPVRVQGDGVTVWAHLTTHWAETLLGVLLSVGMGMAVRSVLGVL